MAMFVESVIVVAVACGVLMFAYFLDSYQAKLFRQAKPSPVNRARK
jgi:hypothetical protein